MNKIFTIAAMFLLIGGTTSAQTHFAHKQKPLKSKLMKRAGKQKVKDVLLQMKHAKEAALMLPKTEHTYFYDGVEWLDDAVYSFEYFSNGNIKQQVLDDGFSKTKTLYDYNENGKVVKETNMVSEDSPIYTNTTKLETVYDQIVDDFIVESTEYMWQEKSWEVDGSQGKTWKKNIIRDNDSKVTSLAISTLFMDNYSIIKQTSVGYDKMTGIADSWKYDELAYDGQNEVMEEVYSLSNLKWKSTDNQIVAIELDQFFTGNNKLEYAEVHEPGAGLVGTMSASYKDNGDYSYEFYYLGNNDADVYEKTYTDNNGSYNEIIKYYVDANNNKTMEDDEVQAVQRLEVVMDDHGRVLSETFYEDDIVMDGMKYEYKYDQGTDYPSEQLYMMWSPEQETYEPFIKVISSDFVDVTTTSIENTITTPENTNSSVYNTMGVKVGNTLEGLPKGLYIVKSSDKTVKVMRQ